jgi:hypothetical protein
MNFFWSREPKPSEPADTYLNHTCEPTSPEQRRPSPTSSLPTLPKKNPLAWSHRSSIWEPRQPKVDELPPPHATSRPARTGRHQPPQDPWRMRPRRPRLGLVGPSHRNHRASHRHCPGRPPPAWPHLGLHLHLHGASTPVTDLRRHQQP